MLFGLTEVVLSRLRLLRWPWPAAVLALVLLAVGRYVYPDQVYPYC